MMILILLIKKGIACIVTGKQTTPNLSSNGNERVHLAHPFFSSCNQCNATNKTFIIIILLLTFDIHYFYIRTFFENRKKQIKQYKLV